jgi:hypothetical protein
MGSGQKTTGNIKRGSASQNTKNWNVIEYDKTVLREIREETVMTKTGKKKKNSMEWNR